MDDPRLTCSLCHKNVEHEEDLCGDLACRDCHKSLSFEDCTSGRWVDEQRRAYGLPPVSEYERPVSSA